MTDRILKIIIPTTFVLSVLTYTFWGVVKEKTGIRIFYPLNALIMVSYSYVVYYLIKQKYNEKGSFLILLTRIIYLTTINNLVDEIFFDPTRISINEYVGFAFLVIFTCYNYLKKKWKMTWTRKKKKNFTNGLMK